MAGVLLKIKKTSTGCELVILIQEQVPTYVSNVTHVPVVTYSMV